VKSRLEYVGPEDAAAITHRNVRTIRKWMNARLIATYQDNVSGKLLVKVDDLMLLDRAQRRANAALNRAGRPRPKRTTMPEASRVDAGG
jgi:pyrimidine operon attenuation protein/uracil phosphoribosyltransferase